MVNSINLADPGIWDDRALVNTWNEALQEYKKYHSIHVQKKSLADVLTDEELLQLKMERRELRTGPTTAAAEFPKETNEDNDDDVAMDVSVDGDSNENTATNTNEATQPPKTTGTTSIPQVLLNNVQDESLRNVMMSWYYAGYYTGLHEVQQNAKKQSSAEKHS
ncbi:hypothetical protein BLS_001395 [Venturia inaequalis]|uniref:Survival motor neuron Tudor domain-containing protein n=1 Tax=Venturia inaequalis TaxID=5025 RepID=A0A8H3UVR0_VENIN|nr:hypothetical protein BLS_001395 [Venturia inaequalis]KAE9979488.1 hypothetical protein EG327_007017 [Venturia inaequalis]KAE9987237.1 hypothetical protein EG328_003370 [Venturia inaequalis]